MQSNSINTNVGAMVALQNLNATNMQLSQTQNRISTGLKVASAKDNGAIWAIAQSQRATSASLDAVKDSLARAQSTVDVAVSAGESVSDLLLQMKAMLLQPSPQFFRVYQEGLDPLPGGRISPLTTCSRQVALVGCRARIGGSGTTVVGVKIVSTTGCIAVQFVAALPAP